jgi:hypothetical protein
MVIQMQVNCLQAFSQSPLSMCEKKFRIQRTLYVGAMEALGGYRGSHYRLCHTLSKDNFLGGYLNYMSFGNTDFENDLTSIVFLTLVRVDIDKVIKDDWEIMNDQHLEHERGLPFKDYTDWVDNPEYLKEMIDFGKTMQHIYGINIFVEIRPNRFSRKRMSEEIFRNVGTRATVVPWHHLPTLRIYGPNEIRAGDLISKHSFYAHVFSYTDEELDNMNLTDDDLRRLEMYPHVN